MKKDERRKTVIIACSIFKNELEYLIQQGKITVPIVYLNSMLHMHPQQLQQLLDSKIKEYSHYNIILLYGDCHARMIDYELNTSIVRAKGINCCEILLGTTRYHNLRKEGAFILLPEWSERWKEAFVDYMGFKNKKSCSLFMNEMHKKITFINTDNQSVNNHLVNEISNYFGLPFEIHQTSVVELEKVLYSLFNTLAKQITKNDGNE